MRAPLLLLFGLWLFAACDGDAPRKAAIRAFDGTEVSALERIADFTAADSAALMQAALDSAVQARLAVLDTALGRLARSRELLAEVQDGPFGSALAASVNETAAQNRATEAAIQEEKRALAGDMAGTAFEAARQALAAMQARGQEGLLQRYAATLPDGRSRIYLFDAADGRALRGVLAE